MMQLSMKKSTDEVLKLIYFIISDIKFWGFGVLGFWGFGVDVWDVGTSHEDAFS